MPSVDEFSFKMFFLFLKMFVCNDIDAVRKLGRIFHVWTMVATGKVHWRSDGGLLKAWKLGGLNINSKQHWFNSLM